MIAARNGSLDLLRKFLSSQTNLDQTDVNGDNALLLAVEQGHQDIVEELCANGADVNFHDGDKCVLRTALRAGSEAKRKKAFKRISTNLISTLGYDIHWQDSHGDTTIKWAECVRKTRCLPKRIRQFQQGE